MAIGESAGLLFKIKGDASDAVRAFKDTEQAQLALTGSTAGLTSGLSSLVGPALAVGAGIAVVSAAAVAGVSALFNLTKSAAEFGSTIFDASQKTGLSAERLSAMKFAADQSGTSLDSVTAATARFSKVIGDAGNGSEQAQAKLKRLGVTSTELDTALKQALATIVKVPPGAQQMALAMDAFGRSGADLLPFIRSFDGDLDALTKKAKELGVTIDDEAAAAADKFSDDLATLSDQFAGLGRTIAGPFMGPFSNMVQAVSRFLTENQTAIQRFGQNTSDILSGFIITIQRVGSVTEQVTGSSLAAWARWAIQIRERIDPVIGLYVRLLQHMRSVGAEARGVGAFAQGVVSPSLGVPTGGGVPRGGGGGGRADNSAQRDAERAQREAERAAAKDLAAQIKIELGNLRTVQEQLSNAFAKIKNDLLGSDVKTVQAALLKFTEQWVDNLLASLNHLDELERQQLDADAGENERAALKQSQEERRHKIKLQFAAEIKKVGDEAFEEQLKQGEILADAAQAKFEADMERAEQLAARLDEIGITSAVPQLNPDAPPEAYDPFQSWIDSWSRFVNQIYADAPTLKQTFQSIGGIITSAFSGMANAIGNVVQGWVLYGETGPAVMRKVLAAALASIAAEAAVRAIWELALGFAALFFNPAEAVAHFTAAALFGTIAGVAAIAGRAVAGNAFRQQTSTATGQTGSNTQGSRASAGAYSGLEPETREMGINRAAVNRSEIVLKIDDRTGWFADMFRAEIQRNSPLRQLIIDTSNA